MSHPLNENLETVPLGLISFDITRPEKIGLHGETYLVRVVDVATGMSCGDSLKAKSEASKFVTVILFAGSARSRHLAC